MAESDYTRHGIRLRDIARPDDDRCPDGMDRDCLVVSYDATHKPDDSYTEARAVSTRLPVECLVLFDDGWIDVAELSADERAWLESASAEHSNRIDFEGTKTGPSAEVSA
jgi:hypothetical protein